MALKMCHKTLFVVCAIISLYGITGFVIINVDGKHNEIEIEIFLVEKVIIVNFRK